ncbi:MAG: sigma-70 family RNA polymerase sigma factor [Clostridia bacterium]|nr:sigma-70 family RNA polymerase sigma factor [Clostridia bacterium]
MTSIEELYEAYFEDVYRYAYALCGDRATAEDVTSQTFLQALGGIGSFRGDCDFRVWLLKIAKNVWYSELRRRKRFSGRPPEELSSPCADPHEFVQRRETVSELHEALHALPEPYREVFSLRVFAELPFRQIGALFGKTEHWACVTYHRAKDKIREKLSEHS